MTSFLKRIERLSFIPGAGFSIDLIDRVAAVRISPNGDVLLDEGEGANRFDGVFIPCRSVNSFEVDQVAEGAELRLWYHAVDGEDWHLLGSIADVPSAQVWAERVNQVYTSRKHERSAGLRTKLSGSVVVRDIYTTRKNIVLPGDYIYSSLAKPPHVKPVDYEYAGGTFPKTGLPAWQDYYMKCCMDQIIEQTGSTNPYTISVGKPPVHDYLWIADKVKYPSVESSVRVTQPLELIFDRKFRHDKIGVIPFGQVEHFAVVFFKGQAVQQALRLKAEEQVAPTFEDWLQAVSETRVRQEKIRICAPQEQSVQYSLKDAVFQNRLEDEQIEPLGRIIEQARWLEEHHRLGLIACDIGVALQIIYHMRQNNMPGADSVELAYVPYEKTVQVGFCYREDDSEWASICANALRHCVEATDGEIAESVAEYARLGKEIGVTFNL
jgi:hypothetical protein